MKKITMKPFITLVAIILFSTNAFAQYIWLNEKGVKQFSDKPPPASVPKSKIIKAPNLSKFQAIDQSKQETIANDNSLSEIDKLEKPKTFANKNEDFNKRKNEREEKAKKDKEQQQIQADNKKHCDSAKSYLRSLDNGNVISTTSQSGERIILNETQRAQAHADTKKAVADCK